jgi:predicted enzyme related to lactoylglutathione lyase
MIKSLTHVTIFVHNQDEALEFYTKKLGFKVHTDAMFSENMRWLTITPSGQKDMELALVKAENTEEKNLVGKQGAKKPLLAFACDDCHKTYETLKKNGVKIINAPETQPWGISMTVEDHLGNMLYLVQSSQ